jgi:transposase-like protein
MECVNLNATNALREARKNTRAGSYQRRLHTKVGNVTLKVSKPRFLPFETAVFERYEWQERSGKKCRCCRGNVLRVEETTAAF